MSNAIRGHGGGTKRLFGQNFGNLCMFELDWICFSYPLGVSRENPSLETRLMKLNAVGVFWGLTAPNDLLDNRVP